MDIFPCIYLPTICTVCVYEYMWWWFVLQFHTKQSVSVLYGQVVSCPCGVGGKKYKLKIHPGIVASSWSICFRGQAGRHILKCGGGKNISPRALALGEFLWSHLTPLYTGNYQSEESCFLKIFMRKPTDLSSMPGI